MLKKYIFPLLVYLLSTQAGGLHEEEVKRMDATGEYKGLTEQIQLREIKNVTVVYRENRK